MSVRTSTVLVGVCLLVAAGCWQKEGGSYGSNGAEENAASVASLAVIKSDFLCKSALREVRLSSHRWLSFG